MSTKTCIFCGGRPSKKSKEHVLPRWLLRLTGDPKRLARFGPTWEDSHRIREFSFDAFTFPACRNCNDKFSHLEGRAASVVEALLDDNPLNGLQVSTLLDWLDKVRVGLWLAMSALDGNIANVKPKFYIESRLRMHDRMVAIFRCAPDLPPLNFFGTVGFGFQYSPTCFALKVKHMMLLNASSPFLCSKSLGFPYADEIQMPDPYGQVFADIGPGTDTVRFPISRYLHTPCNGVRLFQVVFSHWLEDPTAKALWEMPYVVTRSAGMPHGTSQIFVDDGSIPVRTLGPHDTVQALPSVPLTEYETLQRSLECVLDTQLALFCNPYNLQAMSDEDRINMQHHIDNIRQLNDALKLANLRSFRALGYLAAESQSAPNGPATEGGPAGDSARIRSPVRDS
jgi:hypothetical protein